MLLSSVFARATFPDVRVFLSGTDEHGGAAIEAFLLEGEPAISEDQASD